MGCFHVVLRTQDLHARGLQGRGKGVASGRGRGRGQEPDSGGSALGILFPVLLFTRRGGVGSERGLVPHPVKPGTRSPRLGIQMLQTPSEFTPRLPSGPALLPSAPPHLWGRGLGRGLTRRAARRLDDRGKMAAPPDGLLPDGLLPDDPGALSPAQLEQLRIFKVGAPPPPPRLRARAGRRAPRDAGGLFPRTGREAGGGERGAAGSAPAGRSSAARTRTGTWTEKWARVTAGTLT